MGKYWIVKVPCAYVTNGRAIRHKKIPPAPVEIDDFVAEFLGTKVRRVDPFVEPFVDPEPKPRRARRKAKEPEKVEPTLGVDFVRPWKIMIGEKEEEFDGDP